MQPFPWTTPLLNNRSQMKMWLKNSFQSAWGIKLAYDFNCKNDISKCLEGKKQALNAHQTQMQVFQPSWATLSDVSKGDWLKMFFGGIEVFKCYKID